MRKLALMELKYLARSSRPLWGGHLQRGEPITAPDMQEMVDRGLIRAVGTQGYVITDAGLLEISEAEKAHSR